MKSRAKHVGSSQPLVASNWQFLADPNTDIVRPKYRPRKADFPSVVEQNSKAESLLHNDIVTQSLRTGSYNTDKEFEVPKMYVNLKDIAANDAEMADIITEEHFSSLPMYDSTNVGRLISEEQILEALHDLRNNTEDAHLIWLNRKQDKTAYIRGTARNTEWNQLSEELKEQNTTWLNGILVNSSQKPMTSNVQNWILNSGWLQDDELDQQNQLSHVGENGMLDLDKELYEDMPEADADQHIHWIEQSKISIVQDIPHNQRQLLEQEDYTDEISLDALYAADKNIAMSGLASLQTSPELLDTETPVESVRRVKKVDPTIKKYHVPSMKQPMTDHKKKELSREDLLQRIQRRKQYGRWEVPVKYWEDRQKDKLLEQEQEQEKIIDTQMQTTEPLILSIESPKINTLNIGNTTKFLNANTIPKEEVDVDFQITVYQPGKQPDLFQRYKTKPQ